MAEKIGLPQSFAYINQIRKHHIRYKNIYVTESWALLMCLMRDMIFLQVTSFSLSRCQTK